MALGTRPWRSCFSIYPCGTAYAGDTRSQLMRSANVAAARQMQADGWWWHDAVQTDRGIRRGILKEMLRQRF